MARHKKPKINSPEALIKSNDVMHEIIVRTRNEVQAKYRKLGFGYEHIRSCHLTDTPVLKIIMRVEVEAARLGELQEAMDAVYAVIKEMTGLEDIMVGETLFTMETDYDYTNVYMEQCINPIGWVWWDRYLELHQNELKEAEAAAAERKRKTKASREQSERELLAKLKKKYEK